MGKNIASVEFLRKGLSGPIYGLFDPDGSVVAQYPARDENLAKEHFLKLREELKESGYTHLKVATEEIQL